MSFSSNPSSFLRHYPSSPSCSVFHLQDCQCISSGSDEATKECMSDVFEGHVTRLEAYGLQGLSLVVVEVA